MYICIYTHTHTHTHTYIYSDFIFQFTNTTSQTYNLYVSSGTSISINNGTAEYSEGSYIITVGATQSSVIAGIYIPAGQGFRV